MELIERCNDYRIS